jgi:DNA polymerase alpha subunit B
MFSLNELVFSVTTNDILFHLSREEISRNPAVANPQARFSSHLLNQRSFYPLFPPPSREGLPQGLSGVGAGLDVSHIRLADMVNVTPDVLIVPSMLGTFAKVVEGVVVVNPGSASRRQGAGTWVEMTVAPKQAEGGRRRRRRRRRRRGGA